MIRNEKEYKEATALLQAEQERLCLQREKLLEMKLTSDQVELAMAPLLSFHLQQQEEIAAYEQLCRGEFPELDNFEGLGQLLVSLRIARGLTQRDLANRLEVHESQVSRDERNDYHGVTVDRANRILEAIGVHVRTRVENLECLPIVQSFPEFGDAATGR